MKGAWKTHNKTRPSLTHYIIEGGNGAACGAPIPSGALWSEAPGDLRCPDCEKVEEGSRPPPSPNRMAKLRCPHTNFHADVRVDRMEDTGRFSADIQIKCVECGEPFRFLGLPCGVDLNGAAVSPDGTEARLAIGTAETVANILDGDCSVGFTVRRGDS